MKDPIKITQEESQSILNIQSDFQNTLFKFGKLYIEKIQIDKTIKSVTDDEIKLQKEWKDLQDKENILIRDIYKKYGDGNLDLSKGLFIPDESQ